MDNQSKILKKKKKNKERHGMSSGVLSEKGKPKIIFTWWL